MVQHAVQPDLESALAGAEEGPAAQARALSRAVRGATADTLGSSHAPEGHGGEHALLAAAVAYCLGYELRAGGAAVDPDLLRLAALAHDLPLSDDARARLPAPVPRWLANRDLFFDALPGSPFPLSHFASPAEQALYAAHLVAALPLPVPLNQPARTAFAAHPLGRGHALPAVGLVAADAVRIKGYVFESPRLPEIRGASGLLDRLNRVDLPALFGAEFENDEDNVRAEAVRAWFAARAGGARLAAPECVLYAGGGNLLALAPASLAPALSAAIEALYGTETLVAQSVAVARPCELLELQYGLQPTAFWAQEYDAAQADAELRVLLGDDRGVGPPRAPTEFPPKKGFGELVNDLTLAEARRRDERARHPNWEAVPYGRRCTSCDWRVASHDPHGAGGAAADGDRLCAPCQRKRAHGVEGKRTWTERFADFVQASGAETPYARALPSGGWESVGQAPDLDAIAAASSPAGFLGVIYADGDDVGARLAALRSPAEYRAFSHGLAAATERAVYAALAEHLRPRRQGDTWLHPFEVVSIGGDDVLLLVPGSAALALAATLARAFAEQFPYAEATGDPWAVHRYRPPATARDGARSGSQPEAVASLPAATLSLSAGVVVAPAATPIALLRDLAEQLLRSAKGARKQAETAQPSPYRGGYCDFLIARGPGLPATRLEDWRQGRVRRQGRAELRLGAAPYTWPELEGLLATARALARGQFPRSQLHAVRALLDQGEVAAGVDYLYARARLQGDASALARSHLEEAWQSHDRGARPVTPPWRWLPSRDGHERRETILPDLLAVLDFHDPAPADGAPHAAG